MYFEQKLKSRIGKFTAYEFQRASKIVETYIKTTGVILREGEVLDLIGSYVHILREHKEDFNV